MEKGADTTDVMPMVEGKGSKEPVQKESSDGLSFSWTEDQNNNEGEEEGGVVASHEEHQTQDMANDEKKSENEGDSGEEKESEAGNKIYEQVDDSGEEEKNREEGGDFESEGEDGEKASEREGEDEKSEEENENTSRESEGSMAIGNTVIAPLEEASGKKRNEETRSLLAPFTRYEEVSSDEDNLPLSVVGKKKKKTHVKAKTPVIHGRKEVVDEQIIKESRGAKKPRKQVSVVEPIVELDAEDEFDSSLLEKASSQKRKVVKSTKTATPSKRASRGKKRNSLPAVVDKITEFRNRKTLNGKILANTDEKGMVQLVEKIELEGWKHMFVKVFPPVCVLAMVEFYANF
ncbi:uncharacterized protein [Nicotiana tomentosiformis]|uniref:uncharacterized protein n=1 Tax=Nicotiana tomentosiformis TaxID=4098 RepID=UPI00051C1CE2|nr:high mobility group nucleosome-binding domain-containing protein 5-like [Nicotiana tomentosiformis]